MKKVVYSVYRTGKSDSKISGIGYVTEKDLITACIGQNGKPYISRSKIKLPNFG